MSEKNKDEIQDCGAIAHSDNTMNLIKKNINSRRPRHNGLWLIVLATALLALYLWQVLVAAFQYSKFNVPGRYEAKPGLSLPIYPDDFPKECTPVYVASNMTPYADSKDEMHRFSEFREHGNIWLLDSATTVMYESELLKHPRCLQFRLQEVAAARNRIVLVIYDKASKPEILILNNYL